MERTSGDASPELLDLELLCTKRLPRPRLVRRAGRRTAVAVGRTVAVEDTVVVGVGSRAEMEVAAVPAIDIPVSG